ncbi:hypothetical protein HMPREF3213_01744 [Heyndrickxia coagulans]|uniref:Uncharacterized protein n=1 Tax=Heyndrickxia coagulans TaxID=1398 RepID=A0A133KSN1_HEYCO|nr:hypothetical protein HMPREF3213_01744 [Heyndrickxia coagulans]
MRKLYVNFYLFLRKNIPLTFIVNGTIRYNQIFYKIFLNLSYEKTGTFRCAIKRACPLLLF